MAIPKASIRKNVSCEMRRMMSRQTKGLTGPDLLWVEFYQKYSGLIVDFHDKYIDVRLRMADFTYTGTTRLPYNLVWMWIDDRNNLLIYIEHPVLGPIYTGINESDTPDGSWDIALRMVRKGRAKYKKVMSQVS